MRRTRIILTTFPVALLAIALFGCQTVPTLSKVKAQPEFPNGKPIEQEARAVPGSKLKMGEVKGETTDGEKYEGDLKLNQDYQVKVKGGKFNPETMEIELSDDPAEIPAEGYEITITTLATGEKSVYRLRPDFARIHGPEPEEVDGLEAKLLWSDGENTYEIPQGSYLIPGDEYELKVKVNDREGREFSTDNKDFPVPIDRLGVKADGLQQIEGTSKFRTARLPEGRRYGLNLNYTGSPSLKTDLSYTFDDAIAKGPSTTDVSRVTVKGDLGNSDKIKPGDVKPLEVSVVDTRGRSWRLGMEGMGSHATHEFPLPDHRLHVSVENGSYDRTTRQVTFEPNAKSMLKQKFNVEVLYTGEGDELAIQEQLDYLPDFLGIVPLLNEENLQYEGASGQYGHAGHQGREGSRGNDMLAIMGRGGDGRSGGHGTAGQHGARGIAGPNIRVVAREVRTLDAANRLVLFEIRVQGTAPQYHIREFEGPPTNVISLGGKGGDGGKGGNGGKGGDGGKAYFSGHGGDGGDAGPGGDGGDGGNGGVIDLVLATYDLEPIFIADSIGGVGGEGGDAGSSGQPGIPGDTGDWNIEDKEMKGLTPPQMGGYGNEGNIGYRGRKGHDGMKGTVASKVDEQQAAAMVRRAPASLREVILY